MLTRANVPTYCKCVCYCLLQKTEDPSLRLTMLQALRGVVGAAGARMSEKIRPDIVSTLVTLQATADEGHRCVV